MNVKKTYFFAGAYGVGKNTVCATISRITGISEFSASEIISSVNGEQYGANKAVQNKNLNQNILAKSVAEILLQEKEILLSGHFCIFDKNGSVEDLPEQVYNELYIEKIILLEADAETILSHLSERDNKQYNMESIHLLQQKERAHAQRTAAVISKPLLIHKMKFDDSDTRDIVDFINGRTGWRSI